MNKIMLLMILVSFMGCAGMPVSETKVNKNLALGPNEKLAVIPVNSESSVLADALVSEFLGMDIQVIERGQLIKLLQEQKLSLTGILENQDYFQLGKIANVSSIALVRSRMSSSGGVANASIRIVDVQTGDILLNTNYSQPAPDNPSYVGYHNLNDAAKAIGDSIKEKILPKSNSDLTKEELKDLDELKRRNNFLTEGN